MLEAGTSIGNKVPVAVNVSAVQFRQIGFCDLVRRVLKETGLDPEHLELEITESLSARHGRYAL